MVREICASDARIILLDQLLSEERHHALIEGADCFVSLHRSEGLGYHLLEAMYFKVPVITTAYSGPMDFCSQETAYLTEFKSVHVDPLRYHRANAEQVWADPNYRHAASQMRPVFNDRVKRDRIVKNAYQLVNAQYSLESFSERLTSVFVSCWAISRRQGNNVEPALARRLGQMLSQTSPMLTMVAHESRTP